MDTKIVRLSGSTRVGTRLYPTLNSVPNGSKNCSLIRFYIGVKQVLRRTLKGVKQVLSGPKKGSVCP